MIPDRFDLLNADDPGSIVRGWKNLGPGFWPRAVQVAESFGGNTTIQQAMLYLERLEADRQ